MLGDFPASHKLCKLSLHCIRRSRSKKGDGKPTQLDEVLQPQPQNGVKFRLVNIYISISKCYLLDVTPYCRLPGVFLQDVRSQAPIHSTAQGTVQIQTDSVIDSDLVWSGDCRFSPYGGYFFFEFLIEVLANSINLSRQPSCKDTQ